MKEEENIRRVLGDSVENNLDLRRLEKAVGT